MAGRYGQSNMPTIKCSNCNAEIEISAMGDHICGAYTQQSQPPQPNYWERNNGPPGGFSNPHSGRDPRPGRMPPSRIDPGAANQPFQRQDHTAPDIWGSQPPAIGPNRGPLGRTYREGLVVGPPARSNTSPLPYGPPSPEFSNLDCAFPPFVDSRSATPTLGSPSHPDMEHDYVREHAEPNFYGSRSPRRGNNEGLMQRMDTIAPGPFAMGGKGQDQGMSRQHRRSASMGGKRCSFGPPSRQQDPIERPSTAGPGNQRKPSLVSLSGGPRRNDNPPPMPPGPGQGRPVPRAEGGYGFMGQPDSRETSDRSRQRSPPRQGPFGSAYGMALGPPNNMRPPPDQLQPFDRPPRADEGYGGLGPDGQQMPEGQQMFSDNIPPPSRGDGPYGGVGRQLDSMGQRNLQPGMPNTDRQGLMPGNNQYANGPGPRMFDAMPSPTRSQTFPRRDDGKSGPNAPLPRRPSEPSPSGRRRTPSASSRNGPPNPYMPYNAGERDPTPRPPPNGPFPPRGPSRNGRPEELGGYPLRGPTRNGMQNEAVMDSNFPPRGPSRTGARGDYGMPEESQNPYPPRTASRNDVRGRERAPTNPFPPRGPSRNGIRDGSVPPQGSLRIGSRTREPNNFGMEREPALPTLTTANDYDVGDPYHTATDSASSNASTVSVAQSAASSRSSPPLSEVSYQPRRKGSDTSRLNDLMDDFDTYQNKIPYTNKAPGMKLDLARPAFYDRIPDSPTDPAFQQGRLSPILAIPDRDTLAPPTQKPRPSQPSRRPTTAAKGNCRGCGDKITGKSVSSADGRLTGRYHKECFVCKTCMEPFATADFYVIKNNPYCSQHYHALNGSLCKTCDRGIEGEYLETEAKQKFHPTCFTCTTCRQSLRDDYFEMNGKPYCERDAMRAARQPASSNLLGVPGANAGRMHPERRTTRLMMMNAI